MNLSQRNRESLVEYVERFDHYKLFTKDLKPNVAFVFFTNEVRPKGLSEKFIMEWSTTLEEALKMVERYVQMELS